MPLPLSPQPAGVVFAAGDDGVAVVVELPGEQLICVPLKDLPREKDSKPEHVSASAHPGRRKKEGKEEEYGRGKRKRAKSKEQREGKEEREKRGKRGEKEEWGGGGGGGTCRHVPVYASHIRAVLSLHTVSTLMP